MYFENSKEADDFLLILPTSTVVPLNNIFDDTSLNDIMYMKYNGITLGCFVNEGQRNTKLKRLNDVTTVERLLCIKMILNYQKHPIQELVLLRNI